MACVLPFNCYTVVFVWTTSDRLSSRSRSGLEDVFVFGVRVGEDGCKQGIGGWGGGGCLRGWAQS